MMPRVQLSGGKPWCSKTVSIKCTLGLTGTIGAQGVQGLSQDLEIGCPKLAIVKFWGIQIFKGDHNILRFQP